MTSLAYVFTFLSGSDFVRGGLPFLGIASAVVGALIAARHPKNVVGWLFLGSALLSTLRALLGAYAIYGLGVSSGSAPCAEVSAWLSLVIRMPGPLLVFVLVPLFFPTGRPPSRRWNLLVWVIVAVTPVLMFFDAFAPGVAVYGTDIRNPYALDALAPYLGFLRVFLIACLLSFIFAAAASIVARYRSSSGVERQQIKWIALATAIIPVWFSVNAPVGENFPLFFAVVDSLIIAGIPVAAGVAILRHRLYDIDVIINKTLVYGALTVSLGAVYFALVIASELALRTVIGEGSQLAVVASTLAVAMMFRSFRRRIQDFIDRRFYRKRYDARETLEAFSARLRDETDLGELADELVSVVEKTMRPERVSLWMRPTEGPEKRR